MHVHPRRYVAVVSACALFALAITAATAAPRYSAASHVHKLRARPGCPKLFTPKMGERAALRIYSGTRNVPRRGLRTLGYIERCQRHRADTAQVRAFDHRQRDLWWARRHPSPLTDYIVSGRVSVFGPPVEGSGGTADGGSDARPCIAIRDGSTFGRMFRVTINGHTADMVHCDWGPAAWTGRDIDVTGYGAQAMGFDPFNFPTDSYGTAQMLK